MPTNNPPDLLVHMSFADAELIQRDCRSAQIQILTALQNGGMSEKGVRQLVELLETKKRLSKAIKAAVAEQ